MKVEHLPSIQSVGFSAEGVPLNKNLPANYFTRIGVNLCLLYEMPPSPSMIFMNFYIWDLKTGEMLHVTFKDGGVERFGARPGIGSGL